MELLKHSEKQATIPLMAGEAEVRIGEMYEKGLGVKINMDIANNWYRKAAAHSSNDALLRLGITYRDGRSVLKNDVLAYALFKLANKEFASSDAKKALNDLGKKLTSQQKKNRPNISRRNLGKKDSLSLRLMTILKNGGKLDRPAGRPIRCNHLPGRVDLIAPSAPFGSTTVDRKQLIKKKPAAIATGQRHNNQLPKVAP